ncbi:MAG: hybrid sensor histidine kinase/response regulator [Nitrospirota bacterium]
MNRHDSHTLLLVDDDTFVLNAADLLLKGATYNVIPSETAQRALVQFQENSVDVVITDIKMPVMSGIELLERIRTLNPEVPVILMTAYAELDVAIDAIKKGAFDFITKPFKPQQLLHSVEKAVRYRHLLQVEKDYKRILEEFNQEMETLVAERTMSLMSLAIADKVRNPAAAIGWTGRRLLEKEQLPDRAREGIKEIIVQAEKLEAIVKDFHTFLKNRQSMFKYEDINEIVRDVVSVVAREAADRKVLLKAQLAEQPLKINAQRSLLRVAVFHILRNAVEAVPENGWVEVTTSGDKDNVVLTVADSGPGISESDIDKIFEPFFSTKKRKFGMGLPLAKQIITEHLGSITVESEPGKGTTFRVLFPSRWLEKIQAGT